MRVREQPIQDRVGKRRVRAPDRLVPVRDRQLARHDRRPQPAPVLEHLEQILPLARPKPLDAEVVEDEHVDAGDLLDFLAADISTESGEPVTLPLGNAERAKLAAGAGR